jgi:SAM-dependent methyltransferase
MGEDPSRSATRELPAEFLHHLAELETRYLSGRDPLRQSGFSGGLRRWRAERSPILDAMPVSGELLDVGCANGYLLECLVEWAAARALTLVPFGVDISAPLIALAQERLPQSREHFFVANALGWLPPRRFHYVYAVCDCVPLAQFGAFVGHLLSHVVAPQGRLIIGAYGSRRRHEKPLRVEELLARLGHAVVGCSAAGQPETARFAWIDAPPV